MKLDRRRFVILMLGLAAAGCAPAASTPSAKTDAKPADAKPAEAVKPATDAKPTAASQAAPAAQPAATLPPSGQATPAAESKPAAAPTQAAPAAVKPAIAQPASMTEATLMGTWFAQPEEGGYYLAANEGLYKAKNVDLTMKAGGPGVDVVKLVAVGQFTFGMAVSDQIALARNQDVPVVGLMTPFQMYPQILMVHEESGVGSFEDVASSGMRVAVSSTAVYAHYLRKRYGWKEEQLIRYSGQLAEWLNDKERATQALITNEPFLARQAGARPRELMIGQLSGYNPYQKMLFTTEDVIKDQPELVSAVVAASIEGWRAYLESGTRTNEYLKTKNKDLVDDQMAYAYGALKPLVNVGDAEQKGIGVMTQERWNDLYERMKSIELLKPDLDPKVVWTDRFMQPLLKA